MTDHLGIHDVALRGLTVQRQLEAPAGVQGAVTGDRAAIGAEESSWEVPSCVLPSDCASEGSAASAWRESKGCSQIEAMRTAADSRRHSLLRTRAAWRTCRLGHSKRPLSTGSYVVRVLVCAPKRANQQWPPPPPTAEVTSAESRSHRNAQGEA